MQKYKKIIDQIPECPERWKVEIDMGLPPGVSVGDLIHGKKSIEALHQAHKLAEQSNFITENLKRFNSVEIPDSCQNIVSNQIAKLKAMQNIIWNAMISLAVGSVEIKESELHALLDKQACETMTLMELEKLATALSLDDTSSWAREISKIIVTQPTSTISSQKEDPIYDDPEGREDSMLLQPSLKKTTETIAL